MKTIIRYFIAFSVLSLFAFGCKQGLDDSNSLIDGVNINVIADGSNGLTRTTIVDGETPSVKWLDSDELTIYEIVDGEVNATTTTSSTVLSENDYVANFKATIPGADPSGSSYKYAAVYPAAAVSSGSGFYRLLMPNEQTLIGNNLSADSDLLISELYDHGDTRVSNEENVSFKFKRVGTVVKMTLKGITADEKIQKVVITAPHYIAGRVKYVRETSSLVTDSWHYGSEHQNSITLHINNLTATGTDVLWFRVLAADGWSSGENLSIEVETDAANYYRNGKDGDHSVITLTKDINFIDGGLTAFGINLGSYRVAKPAATRYTKVTSDSQIGDGGEYLVVATKKGSSDICALGSYNSTYYNASDVTEGDDSGTKYIDITSEVVNTITLEDAGSSQYYLKDAEENYLSWTTGNSVSRGSKVSSDSFKWTVSTTAITNVGDDQRVLKYNPDSPRFACYTSATNITLYLKDGSLLPLGISFETPSYGFVVNSNDYNDFEGQAVTKTGGLSDDRTVTYSIDSDVNHVVSSLNTSTGAIALSGNIGVATIKASVGAKDGVYKAGYITYTIEVTGAVDYSTTYTTGDDVDVAVSSGGTDYHVTIASTNYDAVKANKAETFTITIPTGTTTLHLFIAAWKDEGHTVTVTGGTINNATIIADSGIQGSGKTYLLDGTVSDYYRTITPASSSTTEITIALAANKRAVIWGVNADQTVDNRDEAGIVWKEGDSEASTATASIEDGDDVLPTIALYNPHSLPVTYSSSNTGVATIVESGVGAGTISLMNAGETTISAIFDGDEDYKPLTVSYTLTVEDNSTAYAFETVAELNSLASSGGEKHGYLTNAVVSYVNGKSAIIKDASGSILLFKENHNLSQGQTFTGALTVTVTLYNGCSELTACDASFSGSTSVVAPESVTLAQLVGHLSTYQNAYVKVDDLTVTAVNGQNITVTDDGGVSSYIIYSSAGNATCIVGDVLNVKGTIAHYGENDQIKAWATDDITITSYAPRAISFSQPTGAAADAGCSIAVSVGGSPIVSGTTVASGTTVTITATEGTDYEFTSWSVSGATVADASSASTTFVMGTSPVSISATFTSTGGGDPEPSTDTYTFTSKSWGDSSSSWTSGKDGNALTSGRGVQVTTGASGANATTKSSFTGVSSVVVTYSTNASNGAGSIAIKVGDNTAHTQSVTKTGGTTDRTLTYSISPSETGVINIAVTCTTNSIYVKSIAITHN